MSCISSIDAGTKNASQSWIYVAQVWPWTLKRAQSVLSLGMRGMSGRRQTCGLGAAEQACCEL